MNSINLAYALIGFACGGSIGVTIMSLCAAARCGDCNADATLRALANREDWPENDLPTLSDTSTTTGQTDNPQVIPASPTTRPTGSYDGVRPAVGSRLEIATDGGAVYPKFRGRALMQWIENRQRQEGK